MSDRLDWAWLVLIVGISVVRRWHVGKAGERPSLRGIPAGEATLMMLWGLAAIVLPFIYVLSPWLDVANYPFRLPQGLRTGGIALFVFAIWLLHRSHADLGRHWSPAVQIKPDHALVTTGVYQRIRHPMYTAHVLWGVAQCVVVRNVVAGPVALILIAAIMVLRIPREERALIDEFGDAYRRYSQTTGRLLPRLASNTN